MPPLLDVGDMRGRGGGRIQEVVVVRPEPAPVCDGVREGVGASGVTLREIEGLSSNANGSKTSLPDLPLPA